MMADIIVFVVLAIMFLGSLVGTGADYGLLTTISSWVMVASVLAFLIYMMWFLGWFGQRVDRDKSVAASYAKINTPETTTDRHGRVHDSKWTALTKSRTDYCDDH
jgi:membrane protein implicated in regulation of membrane protease activity